jgi:hypothetical protein
MPASFRGAGGGEVSGGGTLYMKWGADNKLSQARFMGREKIKYFKEKYKIFYKKIEWFYVLKREKMVYFPLEFRVF